MQFAAVFPSCAVLKLPLFYILKVLLP